MQLSRHVTPPTSLSRNNLASPGAGFVSFVLKLEKGCYLYQFGQYAWTHLILLFVFVPSSFFVSNIFDGIIWFLLPCSLVIANDIFAYLSGASPDLPGVTLLPLDQKVVLCVAPWLVVRGADHASCQGHAMTMQ